MYIPQPYRGFGFITYCNGFNAQQILSSTHTLRGVKLNVTVAEPKSGHGGGKQGDGGGGGGGAGTYQADYSNYGYGTPRGYAGGNYPNQSSGYAPQAYTSAQGYNQQSYNPQAYNQQYYTGYGAQGGTGEYQRGYYQQQPPPQQQQPPPPPPQATGYTNQGVH